MARRGVGALSVCDSSRRDTVHGLAYRGASNANWPPAIQESAERGPVKNMFGSDERLHKRLLEEGSEAQAPAAR